MLDTLIIGAGPAGLTAATYLGRFRRPTLVIDGSASRARWIPRSHNMPGFPQGVGGEELLSQLREQALRYGAEIRHCEVRALSRADAAFDVDIGEAVVRSRYVLLATGVLDHLPALRGVAEAVLRSVVRICPICDAFEATGKNIAVIGNGERGEREAAFLRTYSEHVTLIAMDGADASSRDGRLVSAGVQVKRAAWEDLEISKTGLRLRCGGDSLMYDVVYSALGCTPQNALAASVGADHDQDNALTVDRHQQTSVPGLYAAGDVVRGLNQIVVAAAEGAIAATDIHNRLRNH